MRKFSQADIGNKLKQSMPAHKNNNIDLLSSIKHDFISSKVHHTDNRHANKIVYNRKKPNNTLINIIKKSKLKMIFGIIFYLVLSLILLIACTNDLYHAQETSKKELHFKINNDFLYLNKKLENFTKKLHSQGPELFALNYKKFLMQELKPIMNTYPYLNAYVLAKKGAFNENIKNNSFMDASYFQASARKNILTKNIHQIIKGQNLDDEGFVFFKKLTDNNIFYISPLFEDKYLFIHLDQNIFMQFYQASNLYPFFDLDNQVNGSNFTFLHIKNLSNISVSAHIRGFFQFKILSIYIGIFLVLNYITFLGYRALSDYYDGVQQLTSLNSELTLAQQRKDSYDTQMQHLVETMDLVPWTADPNSNAFTFIGPEISKITGISHENWLAKGFWLAHIHQDDREQIFKAISRIKDEKYVNIEYRVHDKHGNILWFRNMISEKTYIDTQSNEQSTTLLQGLITDITNEKKVFETLEQAKIDAETANQMKSNFLASMSHELRTPLNSIIGFSEIIYSLIAANGSDEQNIGDYSNNILLSAKHLLHLINDILDYSKIEAGQFEVRIEPTAIFEIFESCQILLQSRASQSSISLIIKPPPETLYLYIDAVRIKQVIINLLSNAIKFNRPNGKVALMCQINEKNEVVLSVTDTGIGMKPEDVKVAFDKFRQIDDSKNRHQEGTGLGLSISKSLVELHGGQLTMNSIYGKGTKIMVTLPPSSICQDLDKGTVNF